MLLLVTTAVAWVGKYTYMYHFCFVYRLCCCPKNKKLKLLNTCNSILMPCIFGKPASISSTISSSISERTNRDRLVSRKAIPTFLPWMIADMILLSGLNTTDDELGPWLVRAKLVRFFDKNAASLNLPLLSPLFLISDFFFFFVFFLSSSPNYLSYLNSRKVQREREEKKKKKPEHTH